MPPKTTQAPRARGLAADFVAAPGVARVDADADDVAGFDGVEVELFERLVARCGIAPFGAGGGGEDIQPAGRNDGDAERSRCWG